MYTPDYSSRIRSLDLIRGIALFGILLINIQTYSLFAFLKPDQVYELKLDNQEWYIPTQFFLNLFVKGQGYTLFCFLFGLGFYLMWNKNQQLGLNADRIFKRRLAFLLIIGLLHAFLVWFGDVLHKYALLGYSLLYFNRKTIPCVLKWIAGLASIVIVFQLVNALFFSPSADEAALAQVRMDQVIGQVFDTWRYGSISDVFHLQRLGVVMLYFMSFESGMANFVHYEIMFLLGLIAGRLNLLSRTNELKPTFIKIAFCMFPIAIVLKAVYSIGLLGFQILPADLYRYEELFFSLAGFIAIPLVTVIYLLELVMLTEKKRNTKWLMWIANTGRLGLTNYLMQTCICMALFYGYGAGFAGRFTLLQSTLVAFAIYLLQVVYSNIWINYQPNGPMERLWKRWTYGERNSTS